MFKAFIFTLMFLLTIGFLIAAIFHGVFPLWGKFLSGAVISGVCLIVGGEHHNAIGRALAWERPQR